MNEKLCLVCGDRALGFNFGVISCESCRQFFRRNGTKHEEHWCYLDGKCDISVSSRRSCKKCRLRKCIDVGMKIEYTVSGNGFKTKRNRQKYNDMKAFDSIIESSNDTLILRRQYHSIANQIKVSVKQLKQIETKLKDQSIVMDTNVSLNDVPQKTAESELALMSIVRPLTEFSPYISGVEGSQLTELWSAAQTFKYNIPLNTYIAIDVFDSFQMMANFSERQIKNIVNMAKNLREFDNFCEGDQLSLIKYSCIDIVLLRLVAIYDRDSECLSMAVDDYNTVVMDIKLLKYNECDLYGPKKRLLQHIGDESALDETVLDLLTVIILFNPNRPFLIDKDKTKVQQQKYMRLLQRYLMLRYKSDLEVKTKFQRLIDTTVAVNKLHKINCREFCTALGQSPVSQLFNEICTETYNWRPLL